MEDFDKLIHIITDLINLLASSKLGFIFIGSIIGISIIYKIGYNAGNKKKPPEVKIKLEDSYSLDEIESLGLKEKKK